MTFRTIKFKALLLCVLILSAFAKLSNAGEIRAFSLREANRQLSMGMDFHEQLKTIGGITRFAGMVYDQKTQDIILIGKVRKELPPVMLDDFIVALRSRLNGRAYPLVSIDRVGHTAKSGMQDVRFDGGIKGTQFGRDFLDSDIVLKHYSLDLLEKIKGIDPYLRLYEGTTKEKLLQQNKQVEKVKWFSEKDSKKIIDGHKGKTVRENSMAQSRFWFYVMPEESFIVEREGVYVIEGLRLGVRAETIVKKSTDNKGLTSNGGKDEVGERFARQFSDGFRRASEKHHALKRLKALFDLVAIAEGIAHLEKRPALQHLIHAYAVRNKATPERYRLVRRVGEFRTGDDKVAALVELSGGIKLEAILLALEDGDVSALRTVVLASRPSSNALSWKIPLASWEMPNDVVRAVESKKSTTVLKTNTAPKELSCGLTIQRFFFEEEDTGGEPPVFKGFPDPTPMPEIDTTGGQPHKLDKMLSSQERRSPRIGGVMLNGTANVLQDSAGQDRHTHGDFSLVVKGLKGRGTPSDLKKFITALWSIYYSKEDPGISIDPIAIGADRQLVRYIGQVINTDLGRVMREADYLMKKWAVGTESPGIPGFRDVDTIAGHRGLTYADAFRRFWFVPEDMTFKAGDGMFIFKHGRMVLKTELMLTNNQTHIVQSDRVFAEFFTEHYKEIAAKYPVFNELFEYAKLVSIAKYLKKQGIPLHWFIMSHLDEVMTEDSKGTVETLSKGSKFLKDVRIEGGVEISGQYVMDKGAADAIRRTVLRLGKESTYPQRPEPNVSNQIVVPKNSSFAIEREVFSIVSEKSDHLTTGTNTQFQTDIAIRNGTEPGLELVRYYSPELKDGYSQGEFGQGWHLLRPYRIVPMGRPEVAFSNALIPRKMAVRNLMTGAAEILTFDDNVYELSGYRPDDLKTSRIVGLFWTVSGGMRLIDKLGNEFWFNASFMPTEMRFSKDFGIRFEYGHEEAYQKGLGAQPYRLSSEGDKHVPDLAMHTADGRKTRLPEKLRLTDVKTRKSKVYRIGKNASGFLGYVPEKSQAMDREFIALRHDGIHIFIDANGNEIWFDKNLKFLKYRPLLVKAVIQGNYRWDPAVKDMLFEDNHTARMEYELDKGDFRVSTISLFKRGLSTAIHKVAYHYSEDSLLARISSR